MVVVSAPLASDPDRPLAPDQPPLAVHEVAFVLDHASVEVAPDAIAVRDAVNVSVGAGAAPTVIDTLRLTEPPAPVHVNV